MKRSKPGRRPPKAKAPPPVSGPKERSGVPNRKLTDQTRKLLGKHYAHKYRTTRRG